MASKKSSEPDVESRQGPAEVELVPTKVFLVRMAHWAGGHQTVGIGEKDQWRIENGEHGVMFYSRMGRQQAYFVSFAGIDFIEFTVVKMETLG